MNKMTLADLKSFWPILPPAKMVGLPDERTKATKKNHIHKHNLSFGQRKHAEYLASKK